MDVTIFGSGYVGLVTGACLAEVGNHVVCVDVDPEKIALLNAGGVPIFEPGLDELIQRNRKAGRLSFTTDAEAGVRHGLFQFVAVGTPPDEDGSADLQYVLAAARTIAEHMDSYRIIVDKSTVPVGTADKVAERVRDTLTHRGERARAIMEELYKPFVRTGNPILFMSPESAEMTKYAANAMLAARISLINEIANVCEAVGSDVEDVRRGVGLDRRVGPAFLFPGAGYGGSCFPKDVKALIRVAEQFDVTPHILNAVDRVNTAQKNVLFAKISRHYGGNLKGRCLAVWGLSFKPRTDDMREAPAVTLIDALLEAGARVQAHDPEALDQARRIYGDRITYHRVNYEALSGADALVIVTEWEEFRAPDFQRMRTLLTQPVVFDGRNLYDLEIMRTFGFTYYPIGRQPVTAG
jgi:UDPglucose 6-dehydrogenase